MHRITRYSEDDVRNYDCEILWCNSYHVAELERANKVLNQKLDDCLFALEEIYCKCRINEDEFADLSEIERLQYASMLGAAEIAKHLVNSLGGREYK